MNYICIMQISCHHFLFISFPFDMIIKNYFLLDHHRIIDFSYFKWSWINSNWIINWKQTSSFFNDSLFKISQYRNIDLNFSEWINDNIKRNNENINRYGYESSLTILLFRSGFYANWKKYLEFVHFMSIPVVFLEIMLFFVLQKTPTISFFQ